MSVRLGIDTGGTFTDAVLLDESAQVMASAKSLTTRMDLQQGIGHALQKLPQEKLADVNLVSLSSTLTTNSAVEGKGAPIGVFLIGYDQRQVKATGLEELLGAKNICLVKGGHNAEGYASAELDEEALRAKIDAWRDSVSAFAVSSAFSVRNPEHEQRAAALIRSITSKPVTCGHELASSLGAPRRAMTAALNARMIAYVAELITAVNSLLNLHNITAPLMIVKGDGSLISAESAILQPITTVLSGPAASVVGAMHLSGLKDLIVADMGGTTTDIAVVRQGQPTLSFDGAKVGDWRPMVEAIKLYAIGLGGDSEVSFDPSQGYTIGPRRVVPLSLLISQHPELRPALERQLRIPACSSHNRFAIRLYESDVLMNQLKPDESEALERLNQGPLDMMRVVEQERWLARALARLERRGLVIFSGFTPTDAAHVLGISDHWDVEAANIAAINWARRMRRQYGVGKWVDGDARTPSEDVYARVVKMIASKLVEAGLHDADVEGKQGQLAQSLTSLIMRGDDGATAFAIKFSPEAPIVAVGGPAASYYPAVADALGTRLVLPEHGQVANAVGTVLGKVMQRVHVTVVQPVQNCFRVFLPEGPKDFTVLEQAFECARESAATRARALTLQSGATQADIQFEIEENRVDNDLDGSVFFEARVTAIGSGFPTKA